ncbi:MAG: asparagine synthase (glutamine-hydrolyzing) [Paracoccaceae bacterium]|jgi:asparagine synthase (glutamine-hydrolysing)
MCGIAGIAAKSAINGDAVPAMMSRLGHRGPDGEGIWHSSDHRVVFGHTRLAVIDTSDAGAQPMLDPSGQVALVYNGEIYNYREIAQRLRREGVELRSTCDTEVLLQAYMCWGRAMLADLNGMFAFCIHDSRDQTIFCARDRFAEKPFLFTATERHFAFASEYKALFALSDVPVQIDETRLMQFLADGRTGLDGDSETAFHGVRQLRGGECLTLDLRSMEPRIERYWSPLPDPRADKINFADAVAEFRNLLSDSVKLRLRGDVEIGSCLSGGLDSSAIVCLAREILGEQPYHVFCGRFPGTPADEWEYAKQVIDHTGAIPHVSEPTAPDLLSQIGEFAWFNELPVSSTSQFAQWTVFESAKDAGVTVLLDGQGSDELLGGYEQYFRNYLAALRADGQENAARREADAIRQRYPMALADDAETLKRRIPDGARRAIAGLTGRGSDVRFGLTMPPPGNGASIDTGLSALAGNPLAEGLIEDSFATTLPTLLRYGDRNSMAHSREVRLPFCDHRIAEFVLSLPPGFLMGNVQTKRLLRESIRGLVPDPVRERWNKQGFQPPQDAWMSEQMYESVRNVIHSPEFANRGWWRVGWWRSALERLRKGETHLASPLWMPYITEMWMHHFVDRVQSEPRVPIYA